MILRDKSTLSDFVRAAEKCRGEVFYEDSIGDKLNLKSALSQFVLAIILYKVEDVDYWIRFEPEDCEFLLPFLKEKSEV